MPIVERFNMRTAMRQREFCVDGTLQALYWLDYIDYDDSNSEDPDCCDISIDTADFWMRFSRHEDAQDNYYSEWTRLARYLGFDSLEQAVVWAKSQTENERTATSAL